MTHFVPQGFGWRPSSPDYRDFDADSRLVGDLLQRMPAGDSATPPSIDLREYFLEVEDQLTVAASCAHACLAIVQYFERRAFGRVIRPSRLFLHHNARRWEQATGDGAVDLRTTLKAMIRCGVPPERMWPYEPVRLTLQPDAFLYSFNQPYREIQYLRLDGAQATGADVLRTVKRCLAAGFPACFGCSIPSSLTSDGQIPFRPTFDSPLGGQALVAVGYDDRWLRGSRGALLVRSSWGSDWGDQGHGWLPYAFVEERLAIDFFTIVRPAWIESGEFDSPA